MTRIAYVFISGNSDPSLLPALRVAAENKGLRTNSCIGDLRGHSANALRKRSCAPPCCELQGPLPCLLNSPIHLIFPTRCPLSPLQVVVLEPEGDPPPARDRGFHFCLSGSSYEVFSQHFGQLLPQVSAETPARRGGKRLPSQPALGSLLLPVGLPPVKPRLSPAAAPERDGLCPDVSCSEGPPGATVPAA